MIRKLTVFLAVASIGLTASIAPTAVSADGCGGQTHDYSGVWLDGTTPTADYVLSLPELSVGAKGCYWIAATPQWGINQDTTEVARITDTDLQGGILVAVAGSQADIDAGQNV
ncbi:hypothetical protein [Algirhabdus cladophorae]|uniref:hypothetical protein n=1 Tax=Algirhabdus cladophorae TaxID=3377108 RepID=UPI003B84808C